MARTLQTIYDEMMAYKDTRAELNALNSQSLVAIYKGVFWVCAFGIFLHEKLFDSLRNEVNEIVERFRIGTPDWYVRLAKDFQIGYDLSVTELNELGYLAIDEEAKIISRAAFKEDGGELTLKLAKGDTGALQPLSEEELAQFKSYIEKTKLAGTKVNSISNNPDQITIDVDVYYDTIYSTAEIESLVDQANSKYQLEFPFDGVIYRSAIQDYLLDVQGVVDVEITELSVESPTPSNIVRKYETEAGYFEYSNFSINLYPST